MGRAREKDLELMVEQLKKERTKADWSAVKKDLDIFLERELKEVIHTEEPKPKTIPGEAKIFYFGSQYTIRIPKKLADVLNIDLSRDRFVFKVIIPAKYGKDRPKLIGELKRG